MNADSLLPPDRRGCSRGCGSVGFAVEALEIVEAGGESIKPPAWGGESVAIVAGSRAGQGGIGDMRLVSRTRSRLTWIVIADIAMMV